MEQLHRECELMGFPEEAHARKGMLKGDIAEMLFAYTTATPEAFPSFDADVDKRRTGLPLPWAQVLKRRMESQSALESRVSASGALAQLSDRFDEEMGGAPRQPLRERKQYARVVAAEAVARMLAHAHASDVTLIKVDTACSWTDAFVIASARSEPHLQALAGASLHMFSTARREAAKQGGWGGEGRPAAIEGGRAAAESPDWLVVDMDSVVVHLFMPEMRAEYALEQLWGVEHGCEVVYFDAQGEPLPSTPPDAPAAITPAPAPEAAAAPAPSSYGSWQPVLFDRREGRLRSFQGTPLPNIAPDLEARPSDSSSSDDEDEEEDEPTPEQIAEQSRALARYLEASGRHEERLVRSETRLKERARLAAERRLAKRQAIADAAAEQQSGAAWGWKVEGAEPAPPALGSALCPSARTQRQLLMASAEAGLDYGPGAGRGRHEGGCACVSCTVVRKAVARLAAQPVPAGEASEVGRLVLCPPTCLCTRCAWLRWRVVAYAQRDRAAAAQLGLLYIRRGRHTARMEGTARAKAAAAKAAAEAAKAAEKEETKEEVVAASIVRPKKVKAKAEKAAEAAPVVAAPSVRPKKVKAAASSA